jgi:prolyl 4-hydroxylase
VPAASIGASTPVLHAFDRDVKVLMALASPRVVVFGDLLSSEECSELIRLARERLVRSETVEVETGSSSDRRLCWRFPKPASSRI